MEMIKCLAIFAIISSAYCDTNATTMEMPISTTGTPLPSTSQTSTLSAAISTTVAPPTSTASPNLTTKTVQFPSNRTQFLNTTSYACSCDLTFECDINCCCDIDCSAEIVEAFECSLGVEIDDFFHGEGLERCSVDGGLLCIAHDNVPSIDQKLHMPYHTEYSSYKWPKFIHQPRDLETASNDLSSRDFYKFGDAVMTLDTRHADKYQTINVPALTMGDNLNCFLTEPVAFLKSKAIQCLRSYSELCSYNNNLMTQLMHARLFQRPPKTAQDASEAFRIVIESCKHTFDNCTQISSSGEEVQDYSFDDIYEDIHLTFHTNDTKILSATVKFGCRNELVCSNSDELESSKIIQNIKVNFVNENENRMERRIRKKQRGYNNDELITISRWRPLNESITAPSPNTEMIFDYFRNDSMAAGQSCFMRLPRVNGNGKCGVHYDTIKFNENSQTLCSVELTKDVNSNFTVCQQFQQQLMSQLFNTLNITLNYTLDGYTSDVYVSKFWTPRYEKGSWTRVSLYNLPLWSPEMQETDKMTTCSGLVTSANYKFFYSTVRASGAKKYENLIESLIVEFDKVDELQIPSDDENQTVQNVKIQINVQFVNLFHKNRASSILMMNNFAILLLVSLPFL